MEKPKKTILIVDDEEVFVKYLGNALERMGYTTLRALNSKDGLQLFKERTPDVVFLDFFISREPGVELLAKIRELDDRVKVFFITGVSEDTLKEYKKRYQNARIDGYIQKPNSLDIIKEVLKKLEKGS
ncbi:MAG: response regulator [Endomicrobiales bacterium]